MSERALDTRSGRSLCVAYGKVEALHHVGIRVGEGQIVTVIGPNGAGKTTMLSAIMGVLPHTKGEGFDFLAMMSVIPRWSRWWPGVLRWYPSRVRCLGK
jgi:branched-chain amino acid transport system ATP-binding protein